MDVRMPVMNGIDATRHLRRAHRERCRVLVVTTFDLDDYVLGAVRAGAAGFLLKDQAPDQLAAAVAACARLVPDVVVMDVRMPVMNGIDATRHLRRVHRERCRVLVVTTFDLDDYVLGAVRAGAAGFLLKDQAPDQLAAAVRTIAAGDAIVSPRATARLLREFVEPTVTGPADPAGLTARETDLVRLMARGLSNDELAAAAHISRATVKTHVSNVLAKLGLTSRIQVVVWAFEHGLAGPGPRGG
ncbi:MAG: response regulator [Pseudonocardia sp.]|nr:response regulator [Pseudonocardia sp.]